LLTQIVATTGILDGLTILSPDPLEFLSSHFLSGGSSSPLHFLLVTLLTVSQSFSREALKLVKGFAFVKDGLSLGFLHQEPLTVALQALLLAFRQNASNGFLDLD